MIHDRERLSLRLESRDELPRVHAQLQDFQCDAPGDWRELIGDIDGSHTAFAQDLQNAVTADAVKGSRARTLQPSDVVASWRFHGGNARST